MHTFTYTSYYTYYTIEATFILFYINKSVIDTEYDINTS